MRVLALLFCLITALVQPSRAADVIDIVLALDNSGSMKKNDPLRLLPRVVTEFAGRLGPDDRLGLVAFDQTSRVLLPLSPVKTNTFATSLTAALQQVNYTGRLTDIPGGLEEARKEIEVRGRPGAQRIIVLLTDGEIDLGNIARNSERKIWLRERILPQVIRQGIRIFGVTLTADADVELIQTMAEATKGNYFRLLKADEIPEVFNGILRRLQELRDEQRQAEQAEKDAREAAAQAATAARRAAEAQALAAKAASAAQVSATQASTTQATAAKAAADAQAAAAQAPMAQAAAARATTDAQRATAMATTAARAAAAAQAAATQATTSAKTAADAQALAAQAATTAQVTAAKSAATTAMTNAEATATHAATARRAATEAEAALVAATQAAAAAQAAAAEAATLQATAVEAKERTRTFWLVAGSIGTVVIGVIAIALLVLLVRRRDYAPAVAVPAARLIDHGRQMSEAELAIKKPSTRIGALEDQSDLVVKREGVSRRHALIEFKDDAFFLRDQRSLNGTFLNDTRVDPDDRSGKMIKHGDTLRFGPYSFRFAIDDMLEAEKAGGDGKSAVGDTVRVGEPRVTRRVPAGANPAAPDVTLEKPRDVQAAPAVKPPDPTWIKEPGNVPSSNPHAVAAGDHCDFHGARGAVARCAGCGRLICDLEDPVDQPDGSKACRAVVEGRVCPHQGSSSQVRQSA